MGGKKNRGVEKMLCGHGERTQERAVPVRPHSYHDKQEQLSLEEMGDADTSQRALLPQPCKHAFDGAGNHEPQSFPGRPATEADEPQVTESTLWSM